MEYVCNGWWGWGCFAEIDFVTKFANLQSKIALRCHLQVVVPDYLGVIYSSTLGCHNISILGRSPTKMERRSDMTIAVDWDVKHQNNVLLEDCAFKRWTERPRLSFLLYSHSCI